MAQNPQNACQPEDSLEKEQLQELEIPPPQIAPCRPKNVGEEGYDCEFVEPPQKYLQTECSICLQILREPYIISCCGHSFCRLCIERIKQDEKPCPLCNEASFTLMHNKGLQRALSEFHVRCTHQKAGCQWTGELGELDQHLNVKPDSDEKQLEGCSFAEVECLYCHENLPRRLIKDHQEEQCSKRPYSCDYCREYSSSFEDVEANHWPVCPHYFVSCPNECNWPHIIIRQNLDHHLAKECPLQIVDCEFHYVGCEVRVLRKDMPQHLTENFTHLSLLATLNQKLANQFLMKDEQNARLIKELQQRVEESQTRVEMVKEENQMLKQQLAEQTQTLKDELTKETRALKDRLGEQGEQHDALSHSVTMLREQQAQQQQEQTRLAEQTMNELGQQGKTLRTELTRETQALKQKHDALNQSLTRVREQQQEQARLGREKETLKQQVGRESQNLKREVAQETQALKTEQARYAQAMQNLTEKTESLRKEFKQHQAALDQSVTKLRGEQTRQQQNTEAKVNRLEQEQGRMKREEEELKREMELNQKKIDRRFGKEVHAMHTETLQHCEKIRNEVHETREEVLRHCDQMRHEISEEMKTNTRLTHDEMQKDQHTGTVPVQILMTGFVQSKKDDNVSYSESFYSHPGGYRMCLSMNANGFGDGKGTHVSVFVHLMRGEYDNSLNWPFRGEVTIQLLNQLEYGEHHTKIIPFTDQTPDVHSGRVTRRERGKGWGFNRFIPHTELYLDKYLKNDCLCFRVSKVDLKGIH